MQNISFVFDVHLFFVTYTAFCVVMYNLFKSENSSWWTAARKEPVAPNNLSL